MCFGETRAPRPQDKPPTTHGVQLVSPSQRSYRLSAETAAASFGGILADVSSPAGGRNDSLATRMLEKSFFLFCLSGGSAGTPGYHFLWILNFLCNSFHWRTQCWLLRRLLILLLRPLHRLLQQSSSVQIGSASRWSALQGTCRRGGSAHR